MRKGHTKITLAVIATVFAAASATIALSQGGEGRSESVRVSSPSGGRRTGQSTRSVLKVNRISAPKVPVREMGRVVIRVNEGLSKIQIFREGSQGPIETLEVPKSSTSLIIRTLDVGTYILAASKPGFHDETRRVELEKNQSRRVSVDLRPKMAILSVASNIPEAKISISNIGEFDRHVEKMLVKPDTYRIRVSHRGYISREVAIDLRQAGREERLNLILEPLGVDAVVKIAFDHLEHNRLDEAAALAGDTLELHPRHARANLVLAIAHLRRDETVKAVDRMKKAVAGGETWSIPVTVRVEPASDQTVAATMHLNSRSLRFESPERAGLNFVITRADLGRVDIDGGALVISGHADYHGRTINPRIQVYTDHVDTVAAVLTSWQM